ncbi:MAG: hypothetical protein ACE5OW_08165 [Candidatus Bathyarchaeia archaeon]
MPRIIERTLTIARSILSDERLVSYGLLLLALHITGTLVLYRIFREFDVVTHFLFGFVISEYVSKGARNTGLYEILADKLHGNKWFTTSPHHVDLLIRVLGFSLIGGLFWESAEFFLGPPFGWPPDPFFTLPINLRNIDGLIDVTVGMVGTLVAWYRWRR